MHSFIPRAVGLGFATVVSPLATAIDVTSGPDHLINSACPASTLACVTTTENIDLAVDDTGNAFALWSKGRYPYGPQYRARFDAVTGKWSAPVSFGSDAASQSRIGFDAAGNAVAIWLRTLSSHDELRFSRYSAATRTWTAPVTVEGYAQGSLCCIGRLAVSRNGDAVLVINTSRAGGYLLRYHRATGTWTNLAGSGGGGIQDVAIDHLGNVVVGRIINFMDAEEPDVVRVSYYEAAANIWRHQDYDPETRDGVTSIYNTGMSVSIDRFGHAMAMWQKTTQSDTRTVRQTRSARYLTGRKVWQLRAFPSVSNALITNSVLSADRSSNVTAAWVQSVGGYQKVLSSRYRATDGTWSTPRVIQQGNFHSRRPDLTTDRNNNVIATWAQRTDSSTTPSSSALYRTTVARYKASTGTWAIPHMIQNGSQSSFGGKVEVDAAGRAIVLWSSLTGVVENSVPMRRLFADRIVPK